MPSPSPLRPAAPPSPSSCLLHAPAEIADTLNMIGGSGKKLGIEARRTPRRVFKHPLGVLCRGEYRVQEGLQLSEGGMLFRSDIALKVGDMVIVTLVLPRGGSVVTRAELLYEKNGPSGERQYGLKFATLSLNVKRAIRNYVTAKTQEEAELESQERDGHH